MKDLYEDIAKASACIDELWHEDQRNKEKLIQLWERCAAFANGNQQDINSNSLTAQLTSTNFFVTRYQDNQKQMFTTNEIEPIMRTLVSFMTKTRPTAEIFSSDKTDESKYRARLAERIQEAKYDLDCEQYNSRKAAMIAMTYGTVVRKDFWDQSEGSDAQLPVYDELGNEVVDQDNQVITQDQKTGDNGIAILTPFSISVDWSVTDPKDLPYIQESYLLPVFAAREMFDRDEPGYTGRAKDIVEGGDIGSSLQKLEQIKYSTPYSYGTAPKIVSADKCLVIETYVRPNHKLKKGRLIIKAGGLVVYDSFNRGEDLGSPYYMPYDDVMWHGYNFFKYSEYIGRFWGKGIVESLIPQQMRINEINGAILQNANTLAKVDVLAVEGQLQRGVLNGNGGNVYTFKPHPSGFVPQKWAGTPLPPQFFKEKEDLIQQMVREAGTNFVMSGQPPTGVSAASAIEQLLENATQQMSDMMISWVDFHTRAYTTKLRLIRNFNKLPNKKLINYLRQLSSDALDEEIDSFIGQDIGDGYTLKIEAQSMFPKSEKGKRDMVVELIKGPLGNMVAEDSPRGARLRKNIFDMFGIDSIELNESKDLEKAHWENERMKKGLLVEVWEDDNHPIHLSCHIDEAKDPKFLERANDEVKQSYLDHIAKHKEAIRALMPPAPPPGMIQGDGPIAPQGGPPPVPMAAKRKSKKKESFEGKSLKTDKIFGAQTLH